MVGALLRAGGPRSQGVRCYFFTFITLIAFSLTLAN